MSQATLKEDPREADEKARKARTRLVGAALLGLGFLGGAYFSVEQLGSIRWQMYAPMALLAAIGTVLLRRSAKAGGESKGETDANLRTVEDSITTICDKIRTVAPAKDEDVGEICGRIDATLRDPIDAFVEAREAVTQRYDLDTYASMMDHFAQGERAINRAWCASADGYIDEVRDCLKRAEAHFKATRRVVLPDADELPSHEGPLSEPPPERSSGEEALPAGGDGREPPASQGAGSPVRGILNIVVGGVMIVGGASGELVLVGTQSGAGLVLVGVLLVGVGIFRLSRR